MRNMQPKINTKTCPFLAEKCMKAECGIYNEKFERCEVGILNYGTTYKIKVSLTGSVKVF